MRTADILSTDALYAATHTALCEGYWSVSRRLCEDLARRSDLADRLSTLDAYTATLESKGRAVTLDAGFRQLLQDRIDAVNARAERNTIG